MLVCEQSEEFWKINRLSICRLTKSRKWRSNLTSWNSTWTTQICFSTLLPPCQIEGVKVTDRVKRGIEVLLRRWRMLTCWIVRTPTWIVSASTQVTFWWLKALEKGTKLVSQMHRTLETRILKDLRTNCYKHLLLLYHKPSSTYQSRLVKLWYLFDYRNCRTHILVQSLRWWIPLFRLVKSTSRGIRAWNPNQRKSRRLKQENPFNSNFSMNTAVFLSITKNK
jgi:hypothetical protein